MAVPVAVPRRDRAVVRVLGAKEVLPWRARARVPERSTQRRGCATCIAEPLVPPVQGAKGSTGRLQRCAVVGRAASAHTSVTQALVGRKGTALLVAKVNPFCKALSLGVVGGVPPRVLKQGQGQGGDADIARCEHGGHHVVHEHAGLPVTAWRAAGPFPILQLHPGEGGAVEELPPQVHHSRCGHEAQTVGLIAVRGIARVPTCVGLGHGGIGSNRHVVHRA